MIQFIVAPYGLQTTNKLGQRNANKCFYCLFYCVSMQLSAGLCTLVFANCVPHNFPVMFDLNLNSWRQ